MSVLNALASLYYESPASWAELVEGLKLMKVGEGGEVNLEERDHPRASQKRT